MTFNLRFLHVATLWAAIFFAAQIPVVAGDPSFGAPQHFTTGGRVVTRVRASLAMAKLDNQQNDTGADVRFNLNFSQDGNQDVIEADYDSKTLTIKRGNAGGTSFTDYTITTTDSPLDLAVGDVNGDGKPDLVIVANGNVVVYLNTYDGDAGTNPNHDLSFAAPVSYTAVDATSQPIFLGCVALGHLSSSFYYDIVAGATVVNPDTLDYNAQIALFRHAPAGDGTFLPAEIFTAPGGADYIAVADVNGDSFPDVVVASYSDQSFTIFYNYENVAAARSLGDAQDVNAPQPLRTYVSHPVIGLGVGDVTGDGSRDVEILYSVTNGTTFTQTWLALFVNGGASAPGTFSNFGAALIKQVASVESPEGDVAIGDLNGDGQPEIVVADALSGGVKVLVVDPGLTVSNNVLTVTSELFFATAPGARRLDLGDLNKDNVLDLFVANDDANNATRLDAGSPTPPPPPPVKPLTGRVVQFTKDAYLAHEGDEVLVRVKRAQDSTGTVTVPFTVGGTAVPNPKPHSDYNIDEPANKVLTFGPTEFEKLIAIAISSDAGAEHDDTIVLTLGKPTGNAVTGTPKITTITIRDSEAPTITAANVLTVTPTNPIVVSATDGVKKGGRTFSDWIFSATQTGDKTAAGLNLKVQYAVIPNATEDQWTDLPGGAMTLDRGKNGLGTTWTARSFSLPVCNKMWFRTVTSATDFVAKAGGAVGPFKVVAGPMMSFIVTTESDSDPTGLTVHEDEYITYRLKYRNVGNGPATNVVLKAAVSTRDTIFFSAKNDNGAPAAVKVRDGDLDEKKFATCNPSPSTQIFSGKLTAKTNPDGDVHPLAFEWNVGTVAPGGSEQEQFMIVKVFPASFYSANDPGAGFGRAIVPPPFTLSAAEGIKDEKNNGRDPNTVIQGLMKLSLTRDSGTVSPGGFITYTFTATNNAAFAINSPVVTDVIPKGTVLYSIFDDNGSGDFTGTTIIHPGNIDHADTHFSVEPTSTGSQLLTWRLKDIPKNGGQRTMKFVVQVQYDVPTAGFNPNGTSFTPQLLNTEYNLRGTPPSGGTLPVFVGSNPAPAVGVAIANDPNVEKPALGLAKVAVGENEMDLSVLDFIKTNKAIPTRVQLVTPPNAGPGATTTGIIHYELHVRNTPLPGHAGATAANVVVHDFINADTSKNKPIDSAFVNVNSIKVNGVPMSSNSFALRDGAGLQLPAGADVKLTRAIEFRLGDVAASETDTVISYDVEARNAATLVADAAGTVITTSDYFLKSDSYAKITPGGPRESYVLVVRPVALSLDHSPAIVTTPPANADHRMPGTVAPGETFYWELYPQNSGDILASKVEITCPLPAGVVFEGFFDADGSELPADEAKNPAKGQTGIVKFNLGQLLGGSTGYVRLTCKLLPTSDPKFPGPLRAVNASFDFTPSIAGGYHQSDANRSRAARTFTISRQVANDFVTVPSASSDTSKTGVAQPKQAQLIFGKFAPFAVQQGQLLNYALFFANPGTDTAHNVNVKIYVPNNTEIFTSSPTASYNAKTRIATFAIGELPAQFAGTCILTVKVNQDTGTIQENSAIIESSNAGGLAAGNMTTTVSATDFWGHVHEMWNNSLSALHINLGGALSNAAVRADFKSLNANSQYITMNAADAIVLKNGAFIVPLGPGSNGLGQVLVGGPASVVTNLGGANAIANGLPLVMLMGNGNGIDISTVGAVTGDAIVKTVKTIGGAQGDAASRIGNVTIGGSGRLITNDGATLVNNDTGAGAGVVNARATALIDASGKIVASGAGNFISHNGSAIVAAGAGNIVAAGAGNIVAAGAGNLQSQLKPGGSGSPIVASGAGNIVAAGAGNIVASGAGNIVAAGAGNIVAAGAGN